MKNIICIGGANIDFKFKSKNQLLLNTSNPISSSQSFGGVARNVAHNLAKVTSHIYLQTVVGNDEQGRALLEHMKVLGVNTQYCQILNDKRTSQYHAILNEQGELFIGLADMNIFDELSDDFITSAWDSWPKNSILFLDTNIPSRLIDLMLHKASELELLLCIDPVSVEKTKKLPDGLNSVFLIKADIQEASALSGLPIQSIDDCMMAGRQIRRRGVKNIVISLGKLGYVLMNETHEVHVPIDEVEHVVDVSGAGDAFVAGILHGLQQGNRVIDACKQGARAAAQTIQSVNTVA